MNTLNLFRRAAPLALAFAAAFSATATQAAVVSFNYTAVGVAGTASEGATVTGSFGWDTSVPDTNPVSFQANYVAAGFLTVHVTGGAQDQVSVTVSDVSWQLDDRTAAELIGDTLSGVFSPTFIFLNDLTGAVFNGTDLPQTLSLGAFDREHMLLVAGPAGGQERYELTSITASPTTNAVPEPATPALLAAAGLGFVLTQRRRAAAR